MIDQYNDSPQTADPYTICLYSGNSHTGPERDGVFVTEALDSIEARILEISPGQYIYRLRQTDVINCSDRASASADFWNAHEPELAIMFSANSHRYSPCDFFNWCPEGDTFNMDMISVSHTPLVIGGSCGSADWARTEDPSHGQPTCELFLTEWGKGAIAWLGPAAESFQHGNFVCVLYAAEELFNDPSRSMAESWLAALRRLSNDYSNNADVINTAKSYVFLGDPLSSFNHRLGPPTNIGRSNFQHRLRLEHNFPNPFNPRTKITFSIRKRGLVSVEIYDVKGRLVKTLVNGELVPRSYETEWFGENAEGESVASGVYFVRLKAEGKVFARKMVLIK